MPTYSDETNSASVAAASSAAGPFLYRSFVMPLIEPAPEPELEPMIYATEYNSTISRRLTTPLLAIADFYIQADGTLELFRVQGDGGSGDCVFNVAINGVLLYSAGDRLTLATGNVAVEKTGLAIAVLKNDLVRFDLEAVTGSGLWYKNVTFAAQVQPTA